MPPTIDRDDLSVAARVHGNGPGNVEVLRRYLKGSIVLTTNRGIPSWGQIFDDPMIAAAMLDRLLHRSVVFNIDGESYRMRSHRAAAEKLRKGVTPKPET